MHWIQWQTSKGRNVVAWSFITRELFCALLRSHDDVNFYIYWRCFLNWFTGNSIRLWNVEVREGTKLSSLDALKFRRNHMQSR